jgi:C-terminal processing protease CtpA/Prc
MRVRALFVTVCLVFTLALFPLAVFGAEKTDRFLAVDRERVQVMLQVVTSDVQKYYFDAKLRGVDWNAKVAQAREKIAQAPSYDTALLEIAAVFETLNDSHTSFGPPSDPFPQDYGWQFQMIGSHCYVTEVRPKSDADAKGLKPGDEILSLDGFTPARDSLNKMEYVLNVLLPQPRLQVEFRDQSAKIHKVDIVAKVRQKRAMTDLHEMTGRDAWEVRLEAEDERRLSRPEIKELNPTLMIVKLSAFNLGEIAEDEIIGKARKHSSLILDLRGNPGGRETCLQDLLSGVFDRDVKIADRVTRNSKTAMAVKHKRQAPFTGQLIVLVDSRSASAAELFARVVQLEKRGTILGDRSSGSVMESSFYNHKVGLNPMYHYAVSVSEADLIMTDGQSLEHVGVTPDEIVLPVAADLANGRDPVLARAAETAGASLSPEQAAKLFPYQWPTR